MDGVGRADQRAHAGRSADLVGRQRDEIGAERRDLDMNASGRLNRVADQKSAMLLDDLRRVGDRLDDARFVVRELKRQQRPCVGMSIDRARQMFEIDHPVRPDRHDLDRIGREIDGR